MPSLKSLCGGGVPSSHPSLGCTFSFFLYMPSLARPFFFLFFDMHAEGRGPRAPNE